MLNEKYAENTGFRMFNLHLSDMFRQLLKAMRNSDMITENKYYQLLQNSENYIPFFRVMDSDLSSEGIVNFFESVGGMNPKAIKMAGSVKALEGSSRKIKN